MSRNPLLRKAERWLGQAQKGETFEFWRGADIRRVMMTPEERMTNSQRKAHSEACKAAREEAKRTGKKAKRIKIPDEFEDVKDNLIELFEFVEYHELRGLVETKCIVVGSTGTRVYEMTCMIQRNGLKAVRDRSRAKWG